MNFEGDDQPRPEMDMLIVDIFANFKKLEQVLADSREKLVDMNHRLENLWALSSSCINFDDLHSP